MTVCCIVQSIENSVGLDSLPIETDNCVNSFGVQGWGGSKGSDHTEYQSVKSPNLKPLLSIARKCAMGWLVVNWLSHRTVHIAHHTALIHRKNGIVLTVGAPEVV